jgi:hypothetical protein
VGLLAIHGQKEHSRYRWHLRLQRQKIKNKRRLPGYRAACYGSFTSKMQEELERKRL